MFGTVWKVNTDGTGFTNLHSFTATVSGTNSDGTNPAAGLIVSGNTLYGTAGGGGNSGKGTVFGINTDGTGFTNLHSFTGIDGSGPEAGLILSGNTLYGTAESGGSGNFGALFKINTDGTGFTNLHSFNQSGGSDPRAGLMISGNTLYGTTVIGGSSGSGTVFKVNTDGTGFTNLHSFTAASGSYFSRTNSDGANPYAVLILSGNTLYGTTDYGGSSGSGTVFAINTDGTGFTNLYRFPALDTNSFTTNSDGAFPKAGLILSGNTLYGTAYAGGSSGDGTVFAVKTDGTGFTNLHSFNWNDGAGPDDGLILSGNILYGMTAGGGKWGHGTVFSLSLPAPPQLKIIPCGANVILTWPTNAIGFTLQSTTNLASPTSWSTNSPGPVVVTGQNTVTNPISGAQQFFRLSQ